MMVSARLLAFHIVIAAIVSRSSASYICLCSKNGDAPLYGTPNVHSTSLGLLYEYDCRAIYTGPVSLSSSWNAVKINHKGCCTSTADSHDDRSWSTTTDFILKDLFKRIGYIQMTSSLAIEQCHGDVPATDKVATGDNFHQTTTTSRRSTPTISPSIVLQCPERIIRAANSNQGYTTVSGNKCLELVPYHYSWKYAEDNCKQKGGHLVQILNQSEQNDVIQFLYDVKYRHTVWIGLSDSDTEGSFIWSTDQYEGEENVEEAIRILQELENRGVDDADADDDTDLDRREELKDLNCDGLCNPQDDCDCVIDDCVPDDCDTSRGIQTKLRSMDNPSKKFWGRRTRGRRIAGRICRGITRFRFCRVIGK